MAKVKKTATSPREAGQAESTEVKSMHSAKSSASSAAANQELEQRLKRALADYHNLEKRVDEERKLLSKLSASLLIEKMLPVLDNLQQAQAHLKDEGLEIVIKQFTDILTSEGLEEIAAEGAQFDPHLHEAVETQEGENENTVAKVLTKGYKIDGTVIRPAKVVVIKKSTGVQSDDKSETQKEETKEVSDFA